MDSVRSKKQSKKPWIIGGCLIVVVLIIGIVLCVTLTGSAEESADDKKKVTEVKVKTVPEALKFVKEAVTKTLKKEDESTVEVLAELERLDKKLTALMDKSKTEKELAAKDAKAGEKTEEGKSPEGDHEGHNGPGAEEESGDHPPKTEASAPSAPAGTAPQAGISLPPAESDKAAHEQVNGPLLNKQAESQTDPKVGVTNETKNIRGTVTEKASGTPKGSEGSTKPQEQTPKTTPKKIELDQPDTARGDSGGEWDHKEYPKEAATGESAPQQPGLIKRGVNYLWSFKGDKKKGE